MMYDSSYVCASSYHAYVKYSYSSSSKLPIDRVSILCILHSMHTTLVIYLPALARSMASRR